MYEDPNPFDDCDEDFVPSCIGGIIVVFILVLIYAFF